MELNFNPTSTIKKTSFDKYYDIVIIGAGPAGLTSAVYAKRKGLTTLLIGEKVGGQVLDTTSVENYTGFDYITGEKLAHAFRQHVELLNVPIKEYTKVIALKKQDNRICITMDDDSTVEAKAVIIATGSKPRKLGVSGEDKFYGRGVTYCAICDGPLFADREVIVAGGGNSALEAAIDLAKIANKVKIVHRSEFRADQIVLDKINEFDNIEIYLETKIEKIYGDKLVQGIEVTDKKTGKMHTITASGIFIEIGYLPDSEWLKDTIVLSERGEVIVDANGATNVQGIFAAGDITKVPFKQVIIAAGEGAKAALSANDYINRLK